jgi:hypothetical protein
MHAIGHPSAIEMCAGRLRIIARIDIRFHDFPRIIDIIAKLA